MASRGLQGHPAVPRASSGDGLGALQEDAVGGRGRTSLRAVQQFGEKTLNPASGGRTQEGRGWGQRGCLPSLLPALPPPSSLLPSFLFPLISSHVLCHKPKHRNELAASPRQGLLQSRHEAESHSKLWCRVQGPRKGLCLSDRAVPGWGGGKG